MENKVTELFEKTSDIIEIIISLFLCLFQKKSKPSDRLEREAGICVRESNQCLHYGSLIVLPSYPRYQ